MTPLDSWLLQNRIPLILTLLMVSLPLGISLTRILSLHKKTTPPRPRRTPQRSVAEKKQRACSRFETAHMFADIDNKNTYFTANVKNISRFGLCLSNLPADSHFGEYYMPAIISGHGHKFRMKIKPRWQHQHNNCLTIGFQIEKISWQWIDFTNELSKNPHPASPSATPTE